MKTGKENKNMKLKRALLRSQVIWLIAVETTQILNSGIHRISYRSVTAFFAVLLIAAANTSFADTNQVGKAMFFTVSN